MLASSIVLEVSMSCILFPSPIFGPIHSRRLGLSLGVNLLPPSAKVCSFDCVYCECGLNAKNETKPKLPTREEVKTALEKKLAALLSKNMIPDVITFAGNGEPTSHPKFLEIISDTIELRDKYIPNAKISVLSNSTFVNRPSVMEALQLVDNPIMKLDTVNEDFIHLVDRPNAKYDVEEIIRCLENFKGDVIVQTMFLKGSVDGKEINNTTDEYVQPWLKVLDQIKPREVMIYTIDRETPLKTLKKASPQELDRIKDILESKGYKTLVAY